MTSSPSHQFTCLAAFPSTPRRLSARRLVTWRQHLIGGLGSSVHRLTPAAVFVHADSHRTRWARAVLKQRWTYAVIFGGEGAGSASSDDVIV